MNGGPVAHFGGRNVAAELDEIVGSDGDGWEFLKQQLLPALVNDPFRPEDAVLKELARYASTVEGGKVLAWLHSVTDRAPYPAGFTSIEQAALAAAKHEGRAVVGHLLTRAVAEGQRIQSKGV